MILFFNFVLRIVWSSLLAVFQERGRGVIPQFCYAPLLQKPGAIRLLRLLPSKGNRENLRCELFDYDIQGSDKTIHPYEALSYGWGGSDKPQSIVINSQNVAVTQNLYAALLRLREHHFPRIVWIDALCINQSDDQEKEYQIQIMADIYARASRVIVWLGVAQDDSDRALEEIRIAGERSTAISHTKLSHDAILRLLQRQWFRRIWILQEVTAARHILIICGSTEIDGYAFCLGLKSLDITLQNSIYLVASLMQGAIFRPRHILRSSGRLSLAVCSLGELVDRYHAHEATKRHDKVYALLGMSSDDLSTAGLEPNYKTPWRILMQRLAKCLLGNHAFVKTWDDREMAVVKSRGYVLGQVSSFTTNQNDREDIHITFENILDNPEYGESHEFGCTLPASSNPIQEGDIICLLKGAPKPSIIRPYKDYFAVIQTTAILRKIQDEQGNDTALLEDYQLNEDFLRDFYLLWNWEKTSEASQNQELFENACTEEPWYGFKDSSSRETRLCSVALIFQDIQEYKEAERRFQEAIKLHERSFEKDVLGTLKLRDKLATTYSKCQQWDKAEELQRQILEARKHLQGGEHQDTLNAVANLMSTYGSLGYFNDVEQLQVIRELVKRKEDAAKVTERDLIQIAGARNGDTVMRLLLDRRGDDVEITEEVIKSVMENPQNGEITMRLLLNRTGDNFQITEEVVKSAIRGPSDEKIMRLLLDRRGDNFQITQEVVKSAAGNWVNGEKIMRLLLDRRGDEVKVTEEVIKAAAESDEGVMRLLLDRRGNDVRITEDILKTAVQGADGEAIMRLLFDRRGDEIEVTEEVLKAAVQGADGEVIMRLLFDQRGDEIEVTEEVLKAAVQGADGEVIMRLLFDQRGDEIEVTEEVLKAAVQGADGEVIMRLLFDRRGDEIRITEEVLKAAAGFRGGEVMSVLLDRRGDEIRITEEVVKAAAAGPGEEVMSVLLDRRGDEIRISEEVIQAALDNPMSGTKVIQLLLDRKGDDIKLSERWLREWLERRDGERQWVR